MDNEVLSQLPKDTTVIDSIETYDIDPAESNTDVGAEVGADTTIANNEELFQTIPAIPNLRLER